MRKPGVLVGLFFVIFLISVWWFYGRQPYIVLAGGFYDSGLVYVEPKWNGWSERGLVFLKVVPPEFAGSYPDAKGWWYVKTRTSDIPNRVVKMGKPLETSLKKIEKYYTWKPLGAKR